MTFFIGVDLHKTQFTVHVRTEEESESLDQIRQYPTTADGYTEFLARISRYKETGSDVKIGVESTGNTRFFKNQVEKAGAAATSAEAAPVKKFFGRKKDAAEQTAEQNTESSESKGGSPSDSSSGDEK